MKTRYFALTGVLMAFSYAAMAGMTVSQPVEVTLNADGSGTAIGNLVSARFSANNVEFVGCGVRYSATAPKLGWCQATTRTGVAAFCNIDNNDLFAAVAGISDTSFITFAWNSSGICTRVGFSTQSQYLR